MGSNLSEFNIEWDIIRISFCSKIYKLNIKVIIFVIINFKKYYKYVFSKIYLHYHSNNIIYHFWYKT